MNIVKNTVQKHHGKNYKGTIIAVETTLIPYLRKLFLVKYGGFYTFYVAVFYKQCKWLLFQMSFNVGDKVGL